MAATTLCAANQITLRISCPRLEADTDRSSVILRSGFDSYLMGQWECALGIRTVSYGTTWRCLSICLKMHQWPPYVAMPEFTRFRLLCAGGLLMVHHLSSTIQTSNGKRTHLFLIEEHQACFVMEDSIVGKTTSEAGYVFDIVLLSPSTPLPSSRTGYVLAMVQENDLAFGKAKGLLARNGGEDSNGLSHSEPATFKELFPEKYEDMLVLLADAWSVNTAFVFKIHNCDRKMMLCAHRAILMRYPRFRDLLMNAEQSGDKNHGAALIPIESISLTTFCVLLKFLYTEDINQTVDPSQFLVCDVDQLKPLSMMPGPASTSTVLADTLKERNAAQFYASWEIKDEVSWSDLFLAADRFEILKLREKCLKMLLASVDRNNAMEILFGIGTHFKDEIHAPVTKYIADNLDDAFSIQTHDPFKRFVNHEGYHEVMLELLRLAHRRMAVKPSA